MFFVFQLIFLTYHKFTTFLPLCVVGLPTVWTSSTVRVIQYYVDDIEAVIKASQHFKYEDSEASYAFNKISDLPESKSNLKRAIKERIQLLCASYISLASFLPDEDAEYLLGLHGEQKKKRSIKIMMKMLKEMDKLEKEIRNFDPFSLL